MEILIFDDRENSKKKCHVIIKIGRQLLYAGYANAYRHAKRD